jgi:hypothetical protein
MAGEGPGEGAVLRAKIALARPALDLASSRMWLSGEPAATYVRYLGAMYPVTRAAVPLMRFARRRCLRRPADPLSLPLIAFLTRHIREERGHDRWVGADLAALGSDLAQAALTSPAVTDLIGAQYQLIAAVHPVTLLGCIAVLESAPPGPGLLDHVRAVAGSGAIMTMAGHAVSDAFHATQIFAVLDRLELDARLRAWLGFSALHTARQAVALFDELAADVTVSWGQVSRTGGGAATASAPLAAIGGEAAAADLSEYEAGLLAEIENARDSLPDVVAHSGDVAGGLFL